MTEFRRFIGTIIVSSSVSPHFFLGVLEAFGYVVSWLEFSYGIFTNCCLRRIKIKHFRFVRQTILYSRK
jgi:hypothetical protein